MDNLLAEVRYLQPTGNETEDGLQELELDPPPEVIDADEITLDVAYKVCFCLQVDPERVLFSEETVELPKHPPLSHVQNLVRLLVKNEEDYDIPSMHPTEVKVLMATLTDYFIHASHEK